MIKITVTQPASPNGATRIAPWFWFPSPARRKIRVAQVCVLVFLLFMPFNRIGLSKPGAWPAQTSNILEGLKLIQEGTRLADIGTRAALMESIDKYKAAYECFRKDNLKAGMGTALFAAGASYSSLGQKRRALDNFLGALTYLKEMQDPALNAMAWMGIGLAY